MTISAVLTYRAMTLSNSTYTSTTSNAYIRFFHFTTVETANMANDLII